MYLHCSKERGKGLVSPSERLPETCCWVWYLVITVLIFQGIDLVIRPAKNLIFPYPARRLQKLPTPALKGCPAYNFLIANILNQGVFNWTDSDVWNRKSETK